MPKIYQQQNVYEATKERLKYIFDNFDNIYVSFSGGKDSGVLYNLVLQYMRDNGIIRKIGLFHQDFEAQYRQTSDYVERTFVNAPDFVDRFWCCIPMAVENSLSVYEPWWYTWDDEKPHIWARDMPNYPYVYSLHNNLFGFYTYRMREEEFHRKFNAWYRDYCGGGKTICLLGIRSDESLHRYSAVSAKKHMHGDKPWTIDMGKDVYAAYPIYDWDVEDIWIANGKFGFDYNSLYDLYYKAGLKLDQMRVASPFLSEGRAEINTYRVIDPAMWAKLVGRVNGANFGSIYGNTKAVGYKIIKLPEGHTWETYTKYLLSTLPEESRANYEKIFGVSIDFWHNTGGGLGDDVIEEAKQKGYSIKLNGGSPYSKQRGKQRVIIDGPIPDNTDDITTTKDLPSWKRMCLCILKNDYTCKTMGFAPTKEQQNRINAIKDKYKSIARGDLSV